MLNKIIFYLFCAVFSVTPLVWYSGNFELFEFNKMLFVYLLATLITGSWFTAMIQEKRLIFQRTPLDIPLVLFLVSQIISAFVSIDLHTSIYGYYSRLNGGLLSIISYLLLYWALVSNLSKAQVIILIKATLAGGLVVALWAIPEHFGISPSCVILRSEFSANCWIQDVQSRVFASLGQPNWLGAYLAMLIFPALYFYLKAKTFEEKIFAFSFLGTFYLAFTFTYSRGATFGLIGGIVIFLCLLFFQQKSNTVSRLILVSKPIAFVLISLFLMNVVFGSAFNRIQIVNILPTQSINENASKPLSGLTQLENGGTESGQIRLIVWRGAWEIFKTYPLFGSGVETFAYSYYKYRPLTHNLVSEWDFLYNKAHNEYLNYLATTGIFGLGAYLLIIGVFLVSGVKYLIFHEDTDLSTIYRLLLISLLASYVSYLVQNGFGFSVVVIATFFFLFPGIFYVLSDSTKEFSLKKYSLYIMFKKIVMKSFFLNIAQVIVVIVVIVITVQVYMMWKADIFFALGEKSSESGKPIEAYSYLSDATIYNSAEPYYKSELGYVASIAAVSFFEENATLSAQLKDQAIQQTEKALQISPNNVSFYRTAILTDYNLTTIDPTYMEKTLQTIDRTIQLAPTDPKLLYNKAIILGQIDKNQDAIELLGKAVSIKRNYREAYVALALFLFDEKKYPGAVDNMRKVLQLVPQDPEASKYLNDWGKTGIATDEAKVTSKQSLPVQSTGNK